MNNKECIAELKYLLENYRLFWVGGPYGAMAVIHAIAQLERLDRLKENLYDQIVGHQFMAVNSTFSLRQTAQHEVRKMVYHYIETGEGLE